MSRRKKSARHTPSVVNREADAWAMLDGMGGRRELNRNQIVALLVAVRSGNEPTVALPKQALKVLANMREMTPKEINSIEFSLLADEAEWVPAPVGNRSTEE